jgi:hypothetical protein
MRIARFVERKTNDEATENRWYDQCVKQRWPLIVVSYRKKYAKVTWDHITLPPEWDQRVRNAEDSIVSSILAIFSEHRGPRSHYAINAFAGSIDCLSPDAARIVANQVFNILHAAVEPN